MEQLQALITECVDKGATVTGVTSSPPGRVGVNLFDDVIRIYRNEPGDVNLRVEFDIGLRLGAVLPADSDVNRLTLEPTPEDG